MDFGNGELLSKVRAINSDPNLSDKDKALKRQALFSTREFEKENHEQDEENLKCSVCLRILDRPVTSSCGHNFCIEKWLGTGNKFCPDCKNDLDSSFIQQPRVNLLLVQAIRMFKKTKTGIAPSKAAPPTLSNQDRPDKAFVSERAKKPGLSNASSGKIFVTVGEHHFGPIPAENDPERGRGVLVGDGWNNRLDCRQWGVHMPHVAGIAGQSSKGAQSVVMSGGYEDDEDHGEWFIYTGSGGRDLSGNKRTNEQSFDQSFTGSNKALLVSCLEGHAVRVVRSHKDGRSSYAPAAGVRYDGIYRIEKCWRKAGLMGFLVCRYLFVRCDNEPAPWTSDETGDKKRKLPNLPELSDARDIKERNKDVPAWDWEQVSENTGIWKWFRPPPVSKKLKSSAAGKKAAASKEKLLKSKFGCDICKNILSRPLCTPCGHNFCEACLKNHFTGHVDNRDRGNGRRLRVQKSQKLCPRCKTDIVSFMESPAVNCNMDSVIQKMKATAEALKQEANNIGNEEVEEEESDEEAEEAAEQGDEKEEKVEGEEEQVAEDGNDQQKENDAEENNDIDVTGNVVCFDVAAEAYVRVHSLTKSVNTSEAEIKDVKDVVKKGKKGKRKAVASSSRYVRKRRSTKTPLRSEEAIVISDDD